MTRKTPILTEVVEHELGSFTREWFCKVPGPGVPFAVVRSEWTCNGAVQQVREIRLRIPCAAPKCGNVVEPPRRRFCSDKCARRARRHEKNVENPEYGKATIRMIRALARRIGASDIATFAMIWELQGEVAAALVETMDDLKARGFSYESMAAEIGVSRNAVSQWHKRHQAKLDAAETDRNL